MHPTDAKVTGAARTTPRKVIDVMIVGVPKAGTTTLLKYLGSHPDMTPQQPAEMTYFRDPKLGGELSTHWDRYFAGAPGHGLHVGKLARLIYEPAGLDMLARHNPKVHVVAILRDPVRRAYSQFWFSRLKGLEPLESFEEALTGDPGRFSDGDAALRCQYLEAGLYADPVQGLFDRFGPDHTHIFVLEEFKGSAAAIVAPLLNELGLDPAKLPALAPKHNTAARSTFVQARCDRKNADGPGQAGEEGSSLRAETCDPGALHESQ